MIHKCGRKEMGCLPQVFTSCLSLEASKPWLEGHFAMVGWVTFKAAHITPSFSGAGFLVNRHLKEASKNAIGGHGDQWVP